jgi:hypothetical protein
VTSWEYDYCTSFFASETCLANTKWFYLPFIEILEPRPNENKRFEYFSHKLLCSCNYHLCQLYISSNHAYPALVLFEQVIALNADKFLLYTVTDRNIAFFWYPFHMLPVELCESTCKSSSFPADRKYQKGKSRDNYIIFKNLIQNINVNGFMWFFCTINTILMQCHKI